MNALDTNILIYGFDGRDPQKQHKAQDLMATCDPMALLWQVGCEFLSASRKLVPLGFDMQDAWETLEKLRRSAVVVLTPEEVVWDAARSLWQRHSLQVWDALILGACITGGVTRLYSEDLAGHSGIGGLEIIDPFAH